MEMEPEDCTIRYGNEATYSGLISKKLSKIKHKMQENKSDNSTNPFDAIDGKDNENSTDTNLNTNPFGLEAGSSKRAATNPFGNNDDLADTNPFHDNVPTQTIQKTKSTNPFAADLP
eukprot:UN12404